MEKTNIILGDEYDDKLRDALMLTLKEEGAIPVDKSWAVAGSQEIEFLEVSLDSESVTIEAETYIGLSITGPQNIVERIAEKTRNRLVT